MYNNKPDKSTRNKNILVAVTIFTLVTFNIAQLYINDKQEGKQREKYESKQLELVNTYVKLDSISVKLQHKINLLQNLGGRVDSLIAIKNQLEREKFALRQSGDLAEDRYLEIKGKVQGYNQLLVAKDVEIKELRAQNEELIQTKEQLLQRAGQLNSRVSELETEKNVLETQVKRASAPIARSLSFYSVDENGVATQGFEFKANKLDQIRVSVRIEPNQMVKTPTMKTLYMSIKDPNGQELSNAQAETLKLNGKDIFYARSADFIYRSEGEEVILDYAQKSNFGAGQYRVEIHCDGRTIGSGVFTIK